MTVLPVHNGWAKGRLLLVQRRGLRGVGPKHCTVDGGAPCCPVLHGGLRDAYPQYCTVG